LRRRTLKPDRQSLIDPIALKLVPSSGLHQFMRATTSRIPTIQGQNQVIGRIDYNMSGKDTFFVR